MATNGILLGQDNNSSNSSFQIGDICESTIDKGEDWHECDGSTLEKTNYSKLHAALANTPLDSTFGYFLFKNLNTSIPESLSSSEEIFSIAIRDQYYNLSIMALSIQIVTNKGCYCYLYYCESSSSQKLQDISNYTKVYINGPSSSYNTNMEINLYIFSGSTGTEIAVMIPDQASRVYSRGTIYIISTSNNSIIKTFTSIYNYKNTTDSNYYNYEFFFCKYSSSQKVYYCGTTLGEIFVSTSDTSMEMRAYIGSFTSVRNFNAYYYNNDNALIIKGYQDSDYVGHLGIYELDISSLVNDYTSSSPGTLPSIIIDNSFGNRKSNLCSCFLPSVNNYWYAYFLDKTTGQGYRMRSGNNSSNFSTSTTADLIGVICSKSDARAIFVYKEPDYYLLKTEDGAVIKKVILDDFPSKITNRYPLTSEGFMILNQDYIQIPPSENNSFTKKYIKIK